MLGKFRPIQKRHMEAMWYYYWGWFYLRQVGHKSANTKWVGEGESPRTVVRRDRFEPKSIFKTTWFVHLGYVEKSDIITGQYYQRNYLKPIISVTSTQNLKFLHDIVTQNVTGSHNQAGITTVRRPPYSPDIVPSDFWLFDWIKKNKDCYNDVEVGKTT